MRSDYGIVTHLNRINLQNSVSEVLCAHVSQMYRNRLGTNADFTYLVNYPSRTNHDILKRPWA